MITEQYKDKVFFHSCYVQIIQISIRMFVKFWMLIT